MKTYQELCGIALHFVEQLSLLKKILKHDAENMCKQDKNTSLILQNHHFHLETLMDAHLKKLNENFKIGDKSKDP